MFLTDRVSVGTIRRTADGYLVANAKVARAGVQEYLGTEVGRPEMSVVRVYRPPEEVFSQDTMRSFAFRPMTNSHPNKLVTAETWKAVAIGQTGDEVVRDGEMVRVPLVLMDAKAIKDFEAGKRELSMGYTAEIVFRDGITPDGDPYDAVQTQIRNNHLALVDRARGGDQLRIGDDTPSTRKLTMSDTIKTRTVMVDGLSVETTDAGAQAITKLQKDLQDSKAAADQAEIKHRTDNKALNDQIAKKDAEIDDLKGKVLTDAQVDAKVKARADLITTAKLISDADYSGKSDADIRKAVVVAKLGDAAIKDKPDAYVEARFDILAEDAKKDPVNRALRNATPHAVNDNGYQASVDAINKGPNYKPNANEGGVH